MLSELKFMRKSQIFYDTAHGSFTRARSGVIHSFFR